MQLEQYVNLGDIDEAVKLEAREQIAILAKPVSETSEEETEEAVSRLRRIAPGFLEAAKPVLQQLITEGMRRYLGWA